MMVGTITENIQRELTRLIGVAEESGDTASAMPLLRAKMEIAGSKGKVSAMADYLTNDGRAYK